MRDVRAARAHSRKLAVRALAEVPVPPADDVVDAVLLLLDDPEPAVRAEAARTAGLLKLASAVALLRTRLEDQSRAVREHVLLALVAILEEEALPTVRRALGSAHPELRFQGIACIAELDPRDAQERVPRLLDDEDAEVRGQAAEVLASLGAEGNADHIAQLLDDPRVDTRIEAGLALAALGDERAWPVLIAMLGDPTRAILAAEAAADLHSKGLAIPDEVRDALKREASRFMSSAWTKAGCAVALLRLADPQGEWAARSVLQSFRVEGKDYVVQWLGRLQHQGLKPDVIALVTRPRGVRRDTIEDALAAYGDDTDARAALQRLQ